MRGVGGEGTTSTLLLYFFVVREAVQILNGHTKSLGWSRFRTSPLPSTFIFFSTLFDSQETIYYKLKGGI